MANRKRCRKHVIFLLLVLLLVVVAVTVAVLVLTLGLSFTKELIGGSKPKPGYAVVVGNLTLKILNREFSSDLLLPQSLAFQELSDEYSRQLDLLFLRSNLSQVYCGSKVRSFRNGSIYTTSSIVFLDDGLIESSKHVENVIRLADSSRDWHSKDDDELRLGEFVVCRSCVESKVEFLTLRQKPQVLIHTIAYPTDEDNIVVDEVEKKAKDGKKLEDPNIAGDDTIYMVPNSAPTTTSSSVATPTTSPTPPVPKPTTVKPPTITAASTAVVTFSSTSRKSPTASTSASSSLPALVAGTTKTATTMTATTVSTITSTTLATTESNFPSKLQPVETTSATKSETTGATTTTLAAKSAATKVKMMVATTTTTTPSIEEATDTSAKSTSAETETTTTTTEIRDTENKHSETDAASPHVADVGLIYTSESPPTTEQPTTTTATTTTTTSTTTTSLETPASSDKTTTSEKASVADIATSLTPTSTENPATSPNPRASTVIERGRPAETTEEQESETNRTEPGLDGASVGRVALAPTVITVKDVSAALLDDDVTVTCEIINPHDWTSVVLRHTPLSQSDEETQPSTTIVSLDPTDLYVTATVFSYRVRATYDVTDTNIRLSATITDLACTDLGVVECSLAGRTLHRTSSLGRLIITSPPAPPVLSAPLDVIENKEVTPAITCSTGDVGYPPWKLSLQAELPTSGTPILVPTEEQRFSTGKSCSYGKTLTLKGYLPVLTANGTRLVCQLLSPEPIDLGTVVKQTDHVHPTSSVNPGQAESASATYEPGSEREALTDGQMLTVIRETICYLRGRKPSLIRHPYVCTRYIACEDKQPTVMSCPPNQCFDPVSGNCGVQAVFLEPVQGILDEGLAGLACSVIHVTDWTRMLIRRHSWGTFYDDVVEINADGQVTWHDDSLRRRALTDFRSSASPQLAEFYLWIYVLECSDEDSYKCEVDREGEDSMAGGNLLKVYARPSIPTLVVPTTAMEGHSNDQFKITCEATLGRPRGVLTLKRKLGHEVDFRSVPFSTTTMRDEGACLIRQRGVVTIPGAELASYNASQWVCRVEPPAVTLKALSQASSSQVQELFVLSDEVCRRSTHPFVAHPVYGCEHFLHCGHSLSSVRTCTPGTCFNPITSRCDLPAPAKGGQCSTDKSYLPHGDVCNKYIDCSSGGQTVLTCPTGTLYAREGRCTGDVHDSHCSKFIYGARSRA